MDAMEMLNCALEVIVGSVWDWKHDECVIDYFTDESEAVEWLNKIANDGLRLSYRMSDSAPLVAYPCLVD